MPLSSQGLEYLPVQFVCRRAFFCSDIVSARSIGLCGEKVCCGYVLNKTVISHHALRLAGEVVKGRQFLAPEGPP